MGNNWRHITLTAASPISQFISQWKKRSLLMSPNWITFFLVLTDYEENASNLIALNRFSSSDRTPVIENLSLCSFVECCSFYSISSNTCHSTITGNWEITVFHAMDLLREFSEVIKGCTGVYQMCFNIIILLITDGPR